MTEKEKAMVSFRMPTELLKQVDARAGNLGINRSEWFTNMTRWCLSGTYTTPEALERAAMEKAAAEK
jgi:metal-responsive CopG/Arc/MetJ family transcriptional regulator